MNTLTISDFKKNKEYTKNCLLKAKNFDKEKLFLQYVNEYEI